MEKDYLQSLKIEISRSFRLIPYERIMFHKILGLMKSENGMKVLLRELSQEPAVRASAIFELRRFDNPLVRAAFAELLQHDEISMEEKMGILNHMEEFGIGEYTDRVIAFIEKHKNDEAFLMCIAKALSVLSTRGAGLDSVREFVSSIAVDRGNSIPLRCCAVEALATFGDIPLLENLIKENNENIIYSAYKAISSMGERIIGDAEEGAADDDIPYTYSPDTEDRAILDLRVLIGKMTPQFDDYSNMVKTAFINAMICSNHREFLIYTMKALTSDDSELVDMVLHLLLANVNKLRDPDKLFRNLLALSADTRRKNENIVNIFERYFSGMKEARKNLLLRDKLFNYIVVTLETYFETYRKEFMVTEVIEKGYPENFQIIRKYLLESFTPELKRKVVNYLKNRDRAMLHSIIMEISSVIPYIAAGEREGLYSLLEVLFDNDQKSRENSAGRIEDINFEKRYLRHRILRLCEIIGRLHIDEAATTLVKIFNYVKKYPDEEIFNAVAECLSMLNYSYMLGELEVVLTSGDVRDQSKAVRYLALFSEQRSLNILLDFLRENLERESDQIAVVMNILLRRDLVGNMTANSIFKRMIEQSAGDDLKSLAFLCLGRCAVESDIEYCNDFFPKAASNGIKESIVRAIGCIVMKNSSINRRQVIKHLTEYLKDPSIKVRIYSCALLIYLGNKEAMKSLRDMMIIKNKQIQRDILSIMGNQRSEEFAYFLISLLKEEYGISNDIIPIIGMLPAEELLEVDHFIVNIFKKYEGAELDVREGRDYATVQPRTAKVTIHESESRTLLFVEFAGFLESTKNMNAVDLITVQKRLHELVMAPISEGKGDVSKIIGGRVLTFFPGPAEAANTALSISGNIARFNAMRMPSRRAKTAIQIITGKMKVIGDETLSLPAAVISAVDEMPLHNRVILDSATSGALATLYDCEPLPDIFASESGAGFVFQELINPINSLAIAEDIVAELNRKEQDRNAAQIQLESELKRKKREQKTGSAMEYAQAMDDVGKVLKDELAEITRYVQRRSTDRELINTVEKMVANIHKRYLLETTKIIMQ